MVPRYLMLVRHVSSKSKAVVLKGVTESQAGVWQGPELWIIVSWKGHCMASVDSAASLVTPFLRFG